MSALPIMVIGAGGHALVLLDALTLNGAKVIGLTDVDPSRRARTVLGHPVLGGDEVLRKYSPDSLLLVNGLGSVGSVALRRSVYETFCRAGYRFASVIHASATIARSAVLAQGVQVMAGAVIQPEVSVGENTIVNTGAAVDHGCRVDAHVHLAPGVTLSGDVVIGNETHVGSGATVIQGVRIGARCNVAAGAVVLSDVADGTTVAGVPARETRK
jgi:sugar O-acyltransferase (sialic acid O-acetyltransferase NeuD family)